MVQKSILEIHVMQVVQAHSSLTVALGLPSTDNVHRIYERTMTGH